MSGRRIVHRPSSIVHRRSSIVDRPAAPKRARAKAGRAAGFTLIELLIVVTLIVVLAGIALSTYSTSVRRAKEAVLLEDLFRFKDAIDQYNADKGTYPPELAALVSEGYMRQIPRDPFTESADTWQTVMSESDAANPNAAPGVFDVRSGATGIGMDGRPYTEW